MTLPPMWKVKRELRRIGDKISFPILARTTERFRQTYHDLNLGRFLTETPGNLPLTSRVAVLVLFQPKGLLGSSFLTLDHLAQEGWSVLVVSNAALSEADRARLVRRCAHVIERPNIGYDFGAYREGWRWIERQGHRPDRLILMNDSTWFPLRMQDDSLRRMEAMDIDLAGHIFKTETTEEDGRDHLESHLVMFGPRALAHPAIGGFWTNYVMTDSRVQTIQRGEKGLTQTALGAGLTVRGLLGREAMVDLLARLSDEDLLEVVADLALHSDEGRAHRAAWQAAAAEGRPWRADFMAWTAHELSNSRQHFVSAAYICPAVGLGGMGFVKKANEVRFQLARLALMRKIDARRIPSIDPVVRDEIDLATRSWQAPPEWRADPGLRQIVQP